MEKNNAELLHAKTNRWILFEWITTITVFISCFAYLAHKIDRRVDRTDRLYEMFIELVRERK